MMMNTGTIFALIQTHVASLLSPTIKGLSLEVDVNVGHRRFHNFVCLEFINVYLKNKLTYNLIISFEFRRN